MQNKTVLITGGTAGIGKAIGTALAQKQAQLIIVGSDSDRASQAVEEIKRLSSNVFVRAIVADLSSTEGVDELVDCLSARYPSIDVLVNNVGYISTEREVTTDGFEKVLFLNYLLPFYLTFHLMPMLQAAPAARIVNITGGAYKHGVIDLADLQSAKKYRPYRALAQAKLALVQYSLQLAKKLEETSISVFIADPGVSTSGMGPGNPAWPWLYRKILMPLVATTPQLAAGSPIYAASAGDLEGKTGLLINPKSTVISPAGKADQPIVGTNLWKTSETILGIRYGI